MGEEVLVRAFAAQHPHAVARVLEERHELEAAALLASLPASVSAEVLGAMAPLSAARTLEQAAPASAAAMLDELPPDGGAALLRRVSEATRRRLLADVAKGHARSLTVLLQQEPGTAGALMDPLVLALPENLAAGEALERVRREPEHALYYLYLVNQNNRLVGVVNQRELMLADSAKLLSAIMKPEPDALSASASREGIAGHPAWQRVHALPVVDASGILLGAIRYATARRIERELGTAARAPDRQVTALALAELYGVGLAGFVEWASAAARGPAAGRTRGTP